MTATDDGARSPCCPYCLSSPLTAAGIAAVQQDRAQKEEQRAQDQTRIATARQLIAQAESARPTDTRTAARLGLAAHRIHPDGETQASLVTTLTSNPHYTNTLTDHTSLVYLVAFTPDGRILATTGIDGVILWDLADRTQPRHLGEPLTGHTQSVDLVAFASDRHTLATADSDGAVILWDLKGLNYLLDHVVERACAIALIGLGRDEWARRTQGLPYQETCPA